MFRIQFSEHLNLGSRAHTRVQGGCTQGSGPGFVVQGPASRVFPHLHWPWQVVQGRLQRAAAGATRLPATTHARALINPATSLGQAALWGAWTNREGGISTRL